LEEIKIPGAAFRKKLRRDFPALDTEENIFINKDIYFICDGEDAFSCHEDQSLCTLRRLIIMHILRVSGMDEDEVKSFQEFLKHLSNESCFTLYSKCIRILDIVPKMDSFSDIKLYLRASISHLVNSLKSSTLATSSSPLRQPSKTALKAPDQTVLEEEFEMLVGRMNPFGIFEYPKFSIIGVPISEFLSSKEIGNSLSRIIERCKVDTQQPDSFHYKITLLFRGDGLSFIQFVKFVAEYQEKAGIA
jgi:hypothetical protein